MLAIPTPHLPAHLQPYKTQGKATTTSTFEALPWELSQQSPLGPTRPSEHHQQRLSGKKPLIPQQTAWVFMRWAALGGASSFSEVCSQALFTLGLG